MNDLLYMEIDFNKLKSNLESIKRVTNKDVIPVIKSNAYSMGDIEISKFLDDIGINYVAVVDMTEALRLLNNNIKTNILILNSLQKEEISYLNRYNNLVITINNIQDIINLTNFHLLNKIRLHIQIDTGMNRLGFKNLDDYLKAIELIRQNDKLIIEGIYTHFTGPENRINQENKFLEFTIKYPFKMIHCAASSTYSQSQIGNYVRVGVDLYGGQKISSNKQVIKVVCKPLAINKIKKGETVGYDQDYTAEEDILVAVLPIGYSNGYRRSLRGFPVLVNSKKYQTIGKVCMNHLFVKVDETVNLESLFIITSDQLPISEMAEYLNTVPHEILCMLNINNKRYIK